MLPDTNKRVENHSTDSVNRQISEKTLQRVRYYCEAGPAAITERLNELDQEWDIERALECNASALAFSGVVLAATTSRRWLLLPGAVTGFLLQHALQGWCPPLPVLRRLGFRTAAEINEERYALKALRGDFEAIMAETRFSHRTEPERAMAAASQ